MRQTTSSRYAPLVNLHEKLTSSAIGITLHTNTLGRQGGQEGNDSSTVAQHKIARMHVFLKLQLIKQQIIYIYILLPGYNNYFLRAL